MADKRAQLDYQTPGGDNQTGRAQGPPTAADIRRRWDDSQKATAKERRDHWINTAMCAGEQWLTWDREQLSEVPREPDRVRITVNRLWPTTRTLIAKLLRRPLVFEVAPTSADDASASGSRVGAAVCADVHHRHNWEDLRRQQAWATLKGGTSVLCVEWDPRAGTQLGMSETGKNFGTGDTVESVLNVTQAAAEPGSRDIEHGYWWIKAAVMPPCEAKTTYKLDADPPADASAAMSPMQRRLADGGENVPLCLVLTFFERPNPNNKAGAVAVVVDSRIVEQGPWPFPFKDRLNCVVVRETPNDDRWTGDTIVSAAVPVQVALNQSWSSIVEHMKLAGNARLAVPEGSGDEWADLSDLPAEIVHFNPSGGAKPEWMSPPSMPEWWIQQPQMLRSEIDDLLGVHDVSRGDTPPDVKSGIALTILAEQDDTPLGLLSKESAEAWGRLASLVLRIYEEKVTEGREARVDRPGTAPETVTWSGKDLHGQTTAVVPLNAVEPRSRAGQMALASSVKQMFPEMDMKTFARIADLPDAEDLIEAVDMDVVRARRENGEMFAGNVAEIANFDNHVKHIAEHNNARKSARYEGLDGAHIESLEQLQGLPPDQVGPKTILDAHVLGHEVEAAREMATQLAKAQVSPALAGAGQAHEPPLAGDHASLMAQMPGSATNPVPEVPGQPPMGAGGPAAGGDAAAPGEAGPPPTG